MTAPSFYWKETISCALDEAGITATSEQIDDLARAVEISIECEGLATGRDCIPNPLQSEIEQLKKLRAEDAARYEREVVSAKKAADDYQRDLRWKIGRLQDQLEKALS